MPGLTWTRKISPAEGPYHGIVWEKRDAQITKSDGSIVFRQEQVEVPSSWSDMALNIVAQKYLRGYVGKDGKPGANREASVRQLIDRVVDTIAGWAGYAGDEKHNPDSDWDRAPGGVAGGWRFHKRPKKTMQFAHDVYFADKASWEAWRDDLKRLCVDQAFAFNSPVWFNVGIDEHPQCSACFIVRLEDWLANKGDLPFDMDAHGLLAAQVKEGIIFANGSGSGINLSRVRSKREFLSGGGHATGPLSFARGLDTWASQIKSGGKTRRAAKMLIMDVDHPDIHMFIKTKADEEKIARILKEAGYGGDMDSESYQHAFHQNSNLSVRVSDVFMRAVDMRETWDLVSRSKHHIGGALKPTMIGTEGLVIETVNALDLMHEVTQSCWNSGDPGMQFSDTIQQWHTCADEEPINATNPCGEYVFLDETSCNLGSLNLMKFLRRVTEEDIHRDVLDVEKFCMAVTVTTIAMEVIISNSKYPTESFAKKSDRYRTIGLGYANLGGLLMHQHIPYDSDFGREWASAITTLLTAKTYETSAMIAQFMGPFAGFDVNKASCTRVMRQHLRATDALSGAVRNDRMYKLGLAFDTAIQSWKNVIQACEAGHGIRNAQATVIAPTGTISFFMDCETTGIEPELGLIKYKMLAGGGTLEILNPMVASVLENMGVPAESRAAVEKHILSGRSIRTCTDPEFCKLAPAQTEVFRTSFNPRDDDPSFYLSAEAHIQMMAVVQPFISGAISKTVNLPKEATVEDVLSAYALAWHSGLKCVALYRDGCKEVQPLSTSKKDDGSITSIKEVLRASPMSTADRLLTATKMLTEIETGHKRKAPAHVPTLRCKFQVDGHKGYLHVGFYPDNWDVAEIFVKLSKVGSAMNGFVDQFARLYSVSRQWGAPVQELYEGIVETDFEPHGVVVDDPHIRSCRSIPDYIVRKIDALQREAHAIQGVPYQLHEAEVIPAFNLGTTKEEKIEQAKKSSVRAGKACSSCGSFNVRILGKCYLCATCGYEEGGCYS